MRPSKAFSLVGVVRYLVYMLSVNVRSVSAFVRKLKRSRQLCMFLAAWLLYSFVECVLAAVPDSV